MIDGLLSIDKARDVYGVAIDEVDADALDYDRSGRDGAPASALSGADDRPRGLAPFQVNPMGEQLFKKPAQLYSSERPRS